MKTILSAEYEVKNIKLDPTSEEYNWNRRVLMRKAGHFNFSPLDADKSVNRVALGEKHCKPPLYASELCGDHFSQEAYLYSLSTGDENNIERGMCWVLEIISMTSHIIIGIVPVVLFGGWIQLDILHLRLDPASTSWQFSAKFADFS
jgi:hypothetical protein